MTTIGGKWRAVAALALVVAPGAWFESAARGQVAYTPVVSPLLNGVALSATPVVSADRRYVRMTLNPYFNAFNGFTTYSAPIAAVGGGGFGGAGGVIGGGGGLAGMGGVIGGGGGFPGMGGGYGGMGMGGVPGPMPPTFNPGDTGTYLAGDYPPRATGPGAVPGGTIDPFDQPGVRPMGAAGGNRSPEVADNPGVPDPFAFADVPEGRSVRPAGRTAGRRQSARKSSRRPTSTAKRRR